MNDMCLSLKEVDQDLLVLFLDDARDVAEEVVEERVLYETNGCVHDAAAHLNIDIFTAQAKVQLAHGQCVSLEMRSGINRVLRSFFPVKHFLQFC